MEENKLPCAIPILKKTGNLFIIRRETQTDVEWSIPNFLSLPDKVGAYYYSPSFEFEGQSWKVGVFPNGKCYCSTSYIEPCIDRLSSGPPIKVKYIFALKNLNEKNYVEILEGSRVFERSTMQYLERCIPHCEISQRQREYIASGEFTLVWILKKMRFTGNESNNETGDIIYRPNCFHDDGISLPVLIDKRPPNLIRIPETKGYKVISRENLDNHENHMANEGNNEIGECSHSLKSFQAVDISPPKMSTRSINYVFRFSNIKDSKFEYSVTSKENLDVHENQTESEDNNAAAGCSGSKRSSDADSIPGCSNGEKNENPMKNEGNNETGESSYSKKCFQAVPSRAVWSCLSGPPKTNKKRIGYVIKKYRGYTKGTSKEKLCDHEGHIASEDVAGTSTGNAGNATSECSDSEGNFGADSISSPKDTLIKDEIKIPGCSKETANDDHENPMETEDNNGTGECSYKKNCLQAVTSGMFGCLLPPKMNKRRISYVIKKCRGHSKGASKGNLDDHENQTASKGNNNATAECSHSGRNFDADSIVSPNNTPMEDETEGPGGSNETAKENVWDHENQMDTEDNIGIAGCSYSKRSFDADPISSPKKMRGKNEIGVSEDSASKDEENSHDDENEDEIDDENEGEDPEEYITDLKVLLLSGKYSDVILKVKEFDFNLHRFVLAARNGQFDLMFRQGIRGQSSDVFIIEDCEPNTFRSFIYFLYTGEVDDLNPEKACELYELSDNYQDDELKQVCLDYMMETFSIDSFCDYLRLSLKHDNQELYEKCVDFFISKPKAVLRSAKWLLFLKEYSKQATFTFLRVLEHYKSV